MRRLRVAGVVTGVLDRQSLHGFWLQNGQGREGASAGIFVHTGEASGLTPGDAVTVLGEVTEFGRQGTLTSTQIDATEVTAAGETELPDPVRIGASGLRIPEIIENDGLESFDPREDALDFWESLEGERVIVSESTVVGPSSRFGDFVIVPDSEGADTIRTDAGGVLLRADDENSERIVVDLTLLKDRPSVGVGDELAGPLEGIVHYDYGIYRIMATGLPEIRPASRPSKTAVGQGEQSLSIASYNVLNLSAANKADRFESVAKSIVEDLGAPDIIGLQEIQDDTGGADDGVVSAAGTLQRLVDAIVAAGGPRYEWRQIDPVDNADGGAPGSNIRVAFLIDPTDVEIIGRGAASSTDEVSIETSGGAVRLSESPGRIGTTTECFLGEGASDESEGTRKSLALEVRFQQETYFLINNHLKSKRGDDAVFGSAQPPERRTEAQRRCQAELVAGVARQILREDSKAKVVVVGDMNEHEFRSPMKAFTDAGLIEMIETVPVSQRYSYNYQGNSQVLDHIFVSRSLRENSRLLAQHINTVLPENEAASDHDPLLLIIQPGH